MSGGPRFATVSDGVLMAVAAAAAGVLPLVLLTSVGHVMQGGTDVALSEGLMLAVTTLVWAMIPAAVGVSLWFFALWMTMPVAPWHSAVLGVGLGLAATLPMLGQVDLVSICVGIAGGLAGTQAAGQVWRALG